MMDNKEHIKRMKALEDAIAYVERCTQELIEEDKANPILSIFPVGEWGKRND